MGKPLLLLLLKISERLFGQVSFPLNMYFHLGEWLPVIDLSRKKYNPEYIKRGRAYSDWQHVSIFICLLEDKGLATSSFLFTDRFV